MMSDTLKKSIKHGLEALGVLIATFVIDYFISQIAPELPQTPVLGTVLLILSGVLKWLRESPAVPIKDYVNE